MHLRYINAVYVKYIVHHIDLSQSQMQLVAYRRHLIVHMGFCIL